MKTRSITLAVLIVLFVVLATAQAQQLGPAVKLAKVAAGPTTHWNYYPHVGPRMPHVIYPYYRRYHASTAAESYARGIAAMTWAQGHYNRLTAEARLTNTESYRRELDNHKKKIDTFYAAREMNRAARAAERGPRVTREDLVRYAKTATPERLSPEELDGTTGRVSWPALLQSDEFTPFRAELDRLFAERAANGSFHTQDRVKVEQTAGAMLAELKTHVREVSPMDYTRARRFIESLAYEAQLPVS